MSCLFIVFFIYLFEFYNRRNEMKAFVRKLLFVLLFSVIATPVWASPALDIVGEWDITFKPEGVIEVGGETLDFPTFTVSFTIAKSGTEDGYVVQSESIGDLEDISFTSEGQLFDNMLFFPGREGSPTISSSTVGGNGQELTLDLRFFQFTSEEGLKGDIFVYLGENLGGRVCGVGSKSAVPVPAAAWLLGSGVIALFIRRRRTSE
jgi:hypothetical protein